MKNQNLLPDSKKGGRRKRKRSVLDSGEVIIIAPKQKCLSKLTFREQLIFIKHYHKNQLKRGNNVPVYIETAKELYGADVFDADYPNENAKRNARSTKQRMLRDEKLLRYAVAIGMGNQCRWTKGTSYKNNMEPMIADITAPPAMKK